MAYRARTKDLRVRRTDDGGLVIYDVRTDIGHVLNPATAVVFDACDGFTSVDEVAHRLAARFDLPDDEQVVYVALAELRDKGLLDADDPTTRALDEIKLGISRRSVLKRLALGAAAAAAFPAVLSVRNVSNAAAQVGLAVFAAVPLTLTSTGLPVTITLAASDAPSGGTLAFEILSGPSHGTASIVGDQLTYTPTGGYAGPDEISYRALFTNTTTTTPAPTTPAPTTPAPTTPPPSTTFPIGTTIGPMASSRTAVFAAAEVVASAPATITITVSPAVVVQPNFTG